MGWRLSGFALTGALFLAACGPLGEDDDASAGAETETPWATPTASPIPSQTLCVDADGDGSCAQDDCGDDDPEALPGANERCNDRDDDCDGAIDEGLLESRIYPDADLDGWAGDVTCQAPYAISACAVHVGWSTTCGDCNDADSSVYPLAYDGCDAIDQDCDGQPVEDCMPILANPTDYLCLTDPRLTPANQTATLPNGAAANATFDTLSSEIIADGTPVGAYPVATGEPTSATVDVDVGVQQPGVIDSTGTYTVTDGGTEIGCTPLDILTNTFTLAPSTSWGYRRQRGVAMPNGKVMLVSEESDAHASVYVWSPSGRTLTFGPTLDTYNSSFTTNVHSTPDLVRIPVQTGGYHYLAAWFSFVEVSTATTIRLKLGRSTDDGVSFTKFESDLSFDVSSIYREQLRIAYDPLSKNLLLGIRENNAGTYTGKYYVSTDMGGHWTYLTGSDITTVRNHDIKAWGGHFYAAVLQDEATDIVRFRRMTGAAEGWGTAVDIHNSVVTEECLAFEITPDGVFWTFFRDDTLPGNVWIAKSTDRGATWGAAGEGRFVEDDNAGWASGLKFTTAVYQSGEMHLLGHHLAVSNTYGNSMVALTGGGWSDLTNEVGMVPRGYDSYYPSDIPATRSAQHVFTTSGATAESIMVDTQTVSQMVYDQSNNNSTGFITTTMSGATEMYGHGAKWILSPDSSGGSLTGDEIALRIGANTTASGNDVEAGLRIDMTNRQVRAYDWNAGAAIGSASAVWATGVSVEFWVHVDYLGDGTNSKMTAKYRLSTSRTWTAIVTDQTLTRGAGAVFTMRWGKLAASTARVKTVAFLPFFRGNGTRTYGDTSPALLGRTASSTPDRTPWGSHIHWRGSPLIAGESWSLRARSDHPMQFTSPYSVAPSPLRDWRGDTVSAGATIRLAVYDFGSSYVGKLSRGLLGLCWVFKDAATMRLRRWTGAAWSDVISASTLATAFTDGATGIGRSAVDTYLFFPRSGTTNANPRPWAPDEHAGKWCYMADGGGDEIAGRILTNSAGQFTGASDAVEATLELDPSTVVVIAGTFAGFSTSTATGSLRIYGQEGIAIGTQASDSTRYYLFEATMAPGATVPSSGLLSAGPVIPLSRAYRAGASISWRTDPRLDKPRRVIERSFDSVTVAAGTYATALSPVQTGLTIGAGSTERVTVDNNEQVILGALAQSGVIHGRRRGVPVGFIIDALLSDDPGSATQVFTGEDVAFGYMSRSVDVTTSQGFTRPRTVTRDHSKHGFSLVIDEASFWLPTIG